MLFGHNLFLSIYTSTSLPHLSLCISFCVIAYDSSFVKADINVQSCQLMTGENPQNSSSQCPSRVFVSRNLSCPSLLFRSFLPQDFAHLTLPVQVCLVWRGSPSYPSLQPAAFFVVSQLNFSFR